MEVRESLENSLRGCVKSMRDIGADILKFDVCVTGVSVFAYDKGGNYMSMVSSGFVGPYVLGRFSAFADLYISYFGVDATLEFLCGLL